MSVDIGVELGGVERALELIGFKLRYIDAVGREAAERLVERRWNIPYTEDETCDDRLAGVFGFLELARHDEEACHVVARVLDIGLQCDKAVDFGCQRRGDGCEGLVL